MSSFNKNKEQSFETAPHFKNVFSSTDVNQKVDINIETSESRRPSVVVMPSNMQVNSTVSQDLRNLKLNTPTTLITSEINAVNVGDIKEESESEEEVMNTPTIAQTSFESSRSQQKSPRNAFCKVSKTIPTQRQKKLRSRSLPNIWLNSSNLFILQKQQQQLQFQLQQQGPMQQQQHQQQSLQQPHQIYNNSQLKDHLHNKYHNTREYHSQSLQHNHQNRQHQKQRQREKQKQKQKQKQYIEHLHQQQILLPPVNLHSMQEIDLQEVLKNPQLRHDILFDPQIQFRPNLDGERGQRKKAQANSYWIMISKEIENVVIFKNKRISESSPIYLMFETLKSILLSLIPSKDKNQIEDILDLPLITQQLNSGYFQFSKFSNWICGIFKLHCAPMRDSWVDELNSTFQRATANENEINISILVEGLRMLFSILEAMKLDVANHQIRILRPLLCSSAVTFEKEYFKNISNKGKINFTQSLLWFKKNSIEKNSNDISEILNFGVVNLLSCSSMYKEFPNTFTFDQTRLILLRADLRHIICTKICVILYQTMISQNKLSKDLNSIGKLQQFKKEIMNIIVDSNGNSKWTKNLKNLSIHITTKLFNNLDNSKVDFCFNWLLKQTQPQSSIYKLLEKKLFEKIIENLKNPSIEIKDEGLILDELKNLIERLTQLIEFNQNVFGEMYSSYLS